MTQLIPAQSHEPLFLVRENKNRYPLTAGQVNQLLKKWTDDSGLQASSYSSHCIRRGGLIWAHDAKLIGETLKLMGGWASDVYLH